MSIRTDLALEAHELSRAETKEIGGVTLSVSKHGGITKTVVDVTDDNGAKTLGKDKGRYITIEAPEMKYSIDDYEAVCSMIGGELRRLAPNAKKTLVVGLGNRGITPDALGAAAVDHVIVTGHIKKYMPQALNMNYGDVCAICPGVMGTTGMETIDIVGGVVNFEKPDTIIAIDALAGADISRVCTTVQIADTGIAPGSGVGNHRRGLNYETLGVKVIAIGVPTVISAEVLSRRSLPDEFAAVMVTTKDIDLVIRKMARAIANGINFALHKDLSFKDIENMAG